MCEAKRGVTLQARPTTYRGIRMRSRLEARFAAELDRTGGVTWEYEPRAFADENGQYLPDFRVVQHDPPFRAPIYVEVKPTVEMALRVLERVQIILSSEPECVLIVMVLGTGRFVRFSDHPKWIWAY